MKTPKIHMIMITKTNLNMSLQEVKNHNLVINIKIYSMRTLNQEHKKEIYTKSTHSHQRNLIL